jgi:hypothetical protein
VLWTAEFAPAGIAKNAADLQFSRGARTQTTVSVDSVIDACREWDGHPCEIPTDHRLEITNLPIFLRIVPSQGTIDVHELPHV